MRLAALFSRLPMHFSEGPEGAAAYCAIARAAERLDFNEAEMRGIVPPHRAEQLERVLEMALQAVRAERAEPTRALRLAPPGEKRPAWLEGAK